jgi:glycerol kinase
LEPLHLKFEAFGFGERECDGNSIPELLAHLESVPFVAAVIDSIAYQIRDVFDLMQAESGNKLEALLADGGATRNDRLMRFQADILGCPVLRNTSPDFSALGAAFLAGLAAGVWSGIDEIAELPREFDRFEPKMTEQRRQDLYAGWQAAVAKARR